MERFKKVITDLAQLFEDALPLEHEKLTAVQNDDVAGLEDCMKREQAIMMKIRGLEQKRERTQQELGWQDKSFREIIKDLPEEQQPEMQELFDRLSIAVKVFQDANQSALDTMKVHLKDIERVMKIKDPEGRYTQDGVAMNSDRPMTNQKV